MLLVIDPCIIRHNQDRHIVIGPNRFLSQNLPRLVAFSQDWYRFAEWTKRVCNRRDHRWALFKFKKNSNFLVLLSRPQNGGTTKQQTMKRQNLLETVSLSTGPSFRNGSGQ